MKYGTRIVRLCTILDNAGTFRKTASGTTTVFGGISFNNYGAPKIRRGILAANGGYTLTPSNRFYRVLANP